MIVDVEILKGVSRGKFKKLEDHRAKPLAKVGFLRIVDAEQSDEKPKRSYRRKDMVAEA